WPPKPARGPVAIARSPRPGLDSQPAPRAPADSVQRLEESPTMRPSVSDLSAPPAARALPYARPPVVARLACGNPVQRDGTRPAGSPARPTARGRNSGGLNACPNVGQALSPALGRRFRLPS